MVNVNPAFPFKSPVMNHCDIRISFMDIGDLDDVVSIEKESFSKPWSRKMFLRELELQMSRSLVAKIIKKSKIDIAGYLTYWIVADEIHLQKIATANDFRRSGISSRLMEAMISNSVSNGSRCCTLEVGASNEGAIKLYEKFGFTVQGIRRLYYAERGEDALIMWADLKKCMKLMDHEP
jgi:ribosomal-protein-alanine N-acetyltransferase